MIFVSSLTLIFHVDVADCVGTFGVEQCHFQRLTEKQLIGIRIRSTFSLFKRNVTSTFCISSDIEKFNVSSLFTFISAVKIGLAKL